MARLYDLDPRREYLLVHPLDATGWLAVPVTRSGLRIHLLDHAAARALTED